MGWETMRRVLLITALVLWLVGTEAMVVTAYGESGLDPRGAGQVLPQQIQLAPLRIHPPGPETKLSFPGDQWPYSRDFVRVKLIHMLDQWGETAFVVDETLVRHVCYFYKYFSLIDGDNTNRILARARVYLPDILRIFESQGLPAELGFAIAFVESGFRPNARSPAGAVGMFQFLEESGRRYGLTIQGNIDERKEYSKAARACVRYLRANRNLFGSLVLGLGSYHHGTGKVTRVLLSTPFLGARNFGAIFQNKRLGAYSREYIPMCLSMALIYKVLRSEDMEQIPPIDLKSRKLVKSRSIQELKRQYPELLDFNPDLIGAKRTYRYAYKDGYLLITRLESQKRLRRADKKKALARPPWPKNPAVRPGGIMRVQGPSRSIDYVFQKGNQLAVVASIFGTTVAELKEISENRFLKRRKPKPGDRIRINGLAPTTQQLGKAGDLCGKDSRFETRAGETLRQLADEARWIVRSACPKRQWQMGADITPALIWYWNQTALAPYGPEEPLPSGLSLVIYSDYHWEKLPQKH